jgi:hypothetical protein
MICAGDLFEGKMDTVPSIFINVASPKPTLGLTVEDSLCGEQQSTVDLFKVEYTIFGVSTRRDSFSKMCDQHISQSMEDSTSLL